MKRLLKDIWFVITGKTGRPRLKCFKLLCGQWDGIVIKEPSIVHRTICRLHDLPRRIKSVRDRKYLQKQYEQKEAYLISGSFPYLPVSPEYNDKDFGVVVIDTAIS